MFAVCRFRASVYHKGIFKSLAHNFVSMKVLIFYIIIIVVVVIVVVIVIIILIINTKLLNNITEVPENKTFEDSSYCAINFI